MSIIMVFNVLSLNQLIYNNDFPLMIFIHFFIIFLWIFLFILNKSINEFISFPL